MIKINITLNGESIHIRELHTYFDDGDTINIPVDTFINVVKQNPIGHIDAADLRELCNGNERQYSLFTEDKGRMIAIYAAPVQQVDLTDDEIIKAGNDVGIYVENNMPSKVWAADLINFANVIITKLKGKKS